MQRVLTEFENDLALFVDLLREFTEFLFESEQRAQVRVEPVAQEERVGESWEHALEQADELIHERIQALSAEQAVAPFLLPFLTNQWREVMARAWMDESTRAHTYAQATKTMEQLIWSIQPKTSSDERRELVAILPDMVRQLNAGLDTIEWNGKPRATFTRRLITTHTLAIRLTQSMPLDTGSAALEDRDGQVALQQLDERRAARQFTSVDSYDAQAQSFQRGMWFDVSIEQGTHIRCRLSWVSPMRTRLLFTNRDGFDAFVRSEREVSAMLRAGSHAGAGQRSHRRARAGQDHGGAATAGHAIGGLSAVLHGIGFRWFLHPMCLATATHIHATRTTATWWPIAAIRWHSLRLPQSVRRPPTSLAWPSAM